MKSKNIFFGLLVVTIVAVLAYLVLAEVVDQADINNARLISPIARQNISGSFLINITSPWRNETTGTVMGNFTNVTISFWNSTSNLLVTRLVLTDNNTAVNQTFNKTYNSVGLLTDGIYNISINGTNATGNIQLENRSVFKTGLEFITIDNTVPDVTITSPTDRQNFTLGAGVANGIGTSNITFAIRVQNSSGTAIHVVLFDISNGSSPFNLTGIALNTTVYNASINVTDTFVTDVNITDGNHTFIVFTNDTAGNINRSTSISFIVDTTAPNAVVLLNDSMNTNMFTNISKNIPTFSFNATDGIGGTQNCTLFIDRAANITDITATNRTQTNQIAGRSLVDGNHNWSVTCSDSVLLANTSVVANFTIDTVVPDVTITSPANRQNFTSGAGVANGIGSSNITFAIRVQNSSGTAIHVALFEVTNGSSPFNLTGIALNTTVYNASINVTSAWVGLTDLNITDGNHTMIVFANDTAGNINRSMNVTFVVDTTNPYEVLLLNLTESTNLSKTIPTFSFNASDGIGALMNCSLFVDGIVNVTNVNTTNGTVTNQSVASAALGEGRHNWSVTCSDSVRLSNVSITRNFTVSTSDPVITFINATLSTADTSPRISFNYTHGFLNTANCTLYNATDNVGFNITTAVPNSTGGSTEFTNMTINQTLGDGIYELYVNCTTPANNIGTMAVASRINVTIDTTAPTVSTSSASVTTTTADLSVTTNEASTCKVDTSSSVGYASMASTMTGTGTTHTLLITDLSAGSSHTRYVRCRDDLLNTMSSSTSVDFTTSSSGGGGGGGSGGGVSSGSTGTYEKGVWQSIIGGETASVKLKNGELAFTEVSFAVKETTYGAWVEVRKVDTLPSTVTAFGEKAYRTIRITESNVEKVLQGKPLIQFKVLKTWLSDNKLTKESIALFRYVDGQWNELPTTVGEDDGTYVHYKSTTPGFSYFVVGEKGAATPIGQEVSTVPSEVTTPTGAAGEQPVAEAAMPEEAAAMKKSTAVWLVPLVVLIVLAVILYLYWRRR